MQTENRISKCRLWKNDRNEVQKSKFFGGNVSNFPVTKQEEEYIIKVSIPCRGRERYGRTRLFPAAGSMIQGGSHTGG